MARQRGFGGMVQAMTRDRRKSAAAVLVGLCGVFAIAYFATLPPAPAQYSVTFQVSDPNGGVFDSEESCNPRSGYEWIDEQLQVVPTTGVTPAPITSIFSLEASRLSEDVCQFDFALTISSPPAGPLEQIFGANRVPEELGLYQFSLGNEVIGTELLSRTSGTTLEFNKVIAVTNEVAGLYEVGFKADWCKAGPGVYPTGKWNCGWSYYGSDPVTFSSNESKQTCSGRRDFSDLRAGAVVIISGDNGTVRGALVQAQKLFGDLVERGVNATRTSYYLYSKTSEVMFCPLAWLVPNVPFSPGGYTIKVADRAPYFVSASELESQKYFTSKQVGDRP